MYPKQRASAPSGSEASLPRHLLVLGVGLGATGDLQMESSISLYTLKDFANINGLPIRLSLHFSHIHHTSDAISRLHILKCSIDLLQRLPVRDEFINLQLAGHVVVHQIRELRAAFDTAKSASFPYTSRDELEC